MEHHLRPLEYLQVCARKYPHAWKQAEEMRADKDLPHWPTWCYLPLAGAYAIVSAGGRITTAEEGLDVSRVGALAAWRMTKGIYRFDADILAELWRTPVAGDIPSQVLEHLPEWCVYIETDGRLVMRQPLHGFFAHLEHDVNDRRKELRLLLDYDAGLSPVAVHLGGTLRQGLEQMVYETELQAAQMGMDINALRARLTGRSKTMTRLWCSAAATAWRAPASRDRCKSASRHPADRKGKRLDPRASRAGVYRSFRRGCRSGTALGGLS